MISRQIVDSPITANFERSLKSVIVYLRQMPLSLWRNILIFVALFWMVRSLAQLFWLLVPSPDVVEPPRIAKPPATQVVGTRHSVNLSELQGYQVFGDGSGVVIQEEPEEVATDGIEDGAKETRLNLKLQGVIASSNPTEARAIIADGNDQGLYRIGEDLPKNKGVKLAKVLERRVILDNKGNYESLWLYSEKDFKQTGRASRRVPKSRGGSRAGRASRPPVIEKTVKPEQIPRSISSINDVVRFSVHREGGKVVGFRIRTGRDRELFDQFGLKANDIVTAVNGVVLEDTKQVRSMYQLLRTAMDAQLDILRDGQAVSINISLDEGE